MNKSQQSKRERIILVFVVVMLAALVVGVAAPIIMNF